MNRGPQNRPKYFRVLIIGATKMGPLIFGNSHMPCYDIPYTIYCFSFGPYTWPFLEARRLRSSPEDLLPDRSGAVSKFCGVLSKGLLGLL